jgi:hypothetical protein
MRICDDLIEGSVQPKRRERAGEDLIGMSSQKEALVTGITIVWGCDNGFVKSEVGNQILFLACIGPFTVPTCRHDTSSKELVKLVPKICFLA